MKRAGRLSGVLVALLLTLVTFAPSALAADPPAGQMTWAVHFSLAPTFFDPAETPGIITPYLVLYALHDALVKPMPGKPQAETLAESQSGPSSGLVHDLNLRPGGTSHNGDHDTADQ